MPMDFLVVGASPVPGYELLQQLGGSAFSSVWTVQAPDGSTRMWKIIDLQVANTVLETRNLELLVRLKHHSLNPLLNYHTLTDRKALILETAAPLKSLRDRLKECRYYSPPAVPIHELAPWMTSVAEGLDFLNAPQHEFQGKKASIYHRELKPENMLLFREGNAVVCKVGDFGLAKPVSDQNQQHSQGLANYDYDPPEFYEGSSSPTCDQYALAICCYELRTGRLPFSGSMLEQLSARLNDSPNLSGIESEIERAAFRRALLKDPRQRFETSSAFVSTWISAMMVAEAARTAAAVQESPSVRMRRMPPKSPSLGTSPPPAPAAVPPKSNRFDLLPQPVMLAPSNGPGSAMRRVPPKPKSFSEEPAPSSPEFALVPAVAAVVAEPEVDQRVAQIIQRAREGANFTPPESPAQESASMRLRRAPALSAPKPESDQKVPMPWVFIISMIVLGAIAIIAKELVSRGQV